MSQVATPPIELADDVFDAASYDLPIPTQDGYKATRLDIRFSGSHPLIPRESRRFGDLYRGRAAVERGFGRLKNDGGLTPLRVRGLERVALHADLTMLARLSQALARARAIPLAA